MLAVADVAVTVKDAHAAATWWEEKLGFARHIVDGPGGHAVMVAPPGERFLLHLCAGIGPVEPGNTGIAFMTDEIETLVKRMRAAGVVFPEPYAKRSWGGSAKFADPDGNVFWLLGARSSFVRQERKRTAPAPRRPPRRSGNRPSASKRAGRRAPRG